MAFKLMIAPAVQPINLVQAKAHLRVTHAAEDDLIEELISTAVELLQSETGIALISQNWRVWRDELPSGDVICLPKHPVQRVTQITWYDAEGTPIVLPGSAYFLNTMTRPARLRFDRASCPAGNCNGIEVDFDAGYGDIGSDVPDMLKRALLVLIAHWYEYRGVYSSSDQPVSVPELYRTLTRHYRQIEL